MLEHVDIISAIHSLNLFFFCLREGGVRAIVNVIVVRVVAGSLFSHIIYVSVNTGHDNMKARYQPTNCHRGSAHGRA